MDKPRVVSRRALLESSALMVGLAAGGGLVRPAAAQSKVSKADAKYQDHPHGAQGEQRCEICLQFRPPNSCQIVEGPISPKGYCQFFAARENAQ
jgi:hypothetical protein